MNILKSEQLLNLVVVHAKISALLTVCYSTYEDSSKNRRQAFFCNRRIAAHVARLVEWIQLYRTPTTKMAKYVVSIIVFVYILSNLRRFSEM